MKNAPTYQEHFANWLSSYNFKTFGTFTTSRPLSLPASRRLAVSFARHIRAGSDSCMFWAAEPFDTREGFHFHALIKSELSNLQLWDYWTKERNLGRSQFVDIQRKKDSENSIEWYVSKYITKNLADFDIYATNYYSNNTAALKKTGIPESPEYIKPYK